MSTISHVVSCFICHWKIMSKLTLNWVIFKTIFKINSVTDYYTPSMERRVLSSYLPIENISPLHWTGQCTSNSRHLVCKTWFRRRTFHKPNLTEQDGLWSNTGMTPDSDNTLCVEPKLSLTTLWQMLSNLTLLLH